MNSIIGKRRDGRIALVPSKGNAIGAVEKPNVLAGLIAWYRFEEGSGVDVADSSGNGHDGVASAGMTWETGKVGTYAGGFGGSDNVAIPYSSQFPQTTDFTLACFVKFFSTGTQKVIGLGDGITDTLALDIIGNVIYLNYYRAGSHAYFAEGATSINDNTWHHIIGERNGEVFNVYLDGVLDTVSSADGPLTYSLTNDLTLANGDGGFNYVGHLDDVRIYNRALTQAEKNILANQ